MTAGSPTGMPADPRVLGQLLAAQNLIFILPSEAQLAAFLAEAVMSVPGVAWRTVCLGGTPAPAPAPDVCETCRLRLDDTRPFASPAPANFACALAETTHALRIRAGTSGHTFGYLLLRPAAGGELDAYWPFLENLMSFVALWLENRDQRRQLEASRAELEERVAARTRDLTAAVAALQHSEDRYRRITESITDYVFHVTVEGGRATTTAHGEGCVPVTGYTAEDFAADPDLWIRMVVPEDRAAVIEQAHAILEQRAAPVVEHRIVRKDSVVRWMRNTVVAQNAPDGTLVGYDGIIQDITERHLLQEQLLQSQKMESVGRLAGGVAHDFNNLLTAVLGNAALAGMDLPDDIPDDHPARRDLEEVVAAGERAASLTRQLLAFASKQRVEPVRLDLNTVIADSLKMLRRILGEDIDIETQLAPELGTIEADSAQIQQILVNLSVNARDAMPGGGRLTIETANVAADPSSATEELTPDRVAATGQPYVRLTVADTGTGMPDDVRSRIFEPFFTTKERGKGTGLGLSICHGIVAQMGGRITCSSELGRGTVFDVLLPRVDGPSQAADRATAAPMPRGMERVLVVEDEAAVRRLAAVSLRMLGYTVLEASSGTEAILLADDETAPVQALISDVVMPGMSGPQLAELLQSKHPGLRLLLMSGHAESSILPEDVEARGVAFLPKPFTPEVLARRLRDVLDAR